MVDLAPLNDNDSDYERVVNSVSDKYKCDWDDPIHDSFNQYTKQLQENSKKVHAIRCKAEVMEKEAGALKIDELINKATSLCREADSI